MADFQQAIKWLKEGKKVRRKYWNKDYAVYLSEGGIWYKERDAEFRNTFYVGDFEATDWEIFEEKVELKTLKNIVNIMNSDLEEYNRIGPTPFFRNKIKQEAINDIKELKIGCRNSKILRDILGTHSEEAIIRYIMWKNNLTEEDLC